MSKYEKLASIALIACLAFAGCATTAPAAPVIDPVAEAIIDETPVTWEPAVQADFDANVPRFVKALARQKIEELARERKTCLVDRALYDEAMAKYSKK
ncbi:MAG: PCP reductase family protein [Rectinemataceae bacterium]